MDSLKAAELQRRLLGRRIGDWQLCRLIDHGKSAAVFQASKGSELAAVKIFDRELIERFGSEVQFARIERELALKEHAHPNLVRIFDGGLDVGSGEHFVAMEFHPEPSLERQVGDVSPDGIIAIVRQLASAAKFLEDHRLVHRDIKPSNIAWDSRSNQSTLLDLGVIGPIGGIGHLTDVGGRSFIGTLQYSPPEYLLREEEDTQDGWRAVTFYQIGAVIHDLIMKKRLFQEFSEPYGRLVNAVQYQQPVIQSSTVSPSLVELARRCLVKRPDVRLSLVSWLDFENLGVVEKSSAKERVTNRTLLAVANSSFDASPVDEERQRVTLETEVLALLRAMIRAIRQDNSIFPPVRVVPQASTSSLRFLFEQSVAHGLPDGLDLVVRCNVIDPSEKVIEILGQKQKLGHVAELLVFRGVLDNSAIHAALEEFVYTMLDDEQQARG